MRQRQARERAWKRPTADSTTPTYLNPALDNLPPWPYYEGTMNASILQIQTGSFFSARLGRGGLVFALLVVAVL